MPLSGAGCGCDEERLRPAENGKVAKRNPCSNELNVIDRSEKLLLRLKRIIQSGYTNLHTRPHNPSQNSGLCD